MMHRRRAAIQSPPEFAADGTVAGHDGCARFRGRYRITGLR